MSQCVRSATIGDTNICAPPPWVDTTDAAGSWPTLRAAAEGSDLRSARNGDRTFVAARLAGATLLGPAALQEAVRSLYLRIHEEIRTQGPSRAVRFWNYIPVIHEPMGGGLSRYMVFNAGRFAAMTQVHQGPDQFQRRVATATGVGYEGEDLLVYGLATPAGGRPVENPRQVPAYRYSPRHGPVPPCFARATVITIAGVRIGLIGGTASVRGEDSVNADDLDGQLEETFENLEHLFLAARGDPGHGDGPPPRPRHLRAYVVRPGDASTVRARIAERFPALDSLEIVRADVCRPELLVEIEGVVEL